MDRGLATADRQKIEGYLAQKWGLLEEFPYDHPYAEPNSSLVTMERSLPTEL